jgi:hypothetical protein
MKRQKGGFCETCGLKLIEEWDRNYDPKTGKKTKHYICPDGCKHNYCDYVDITKTIYLLGFIPLTTQNKVCARCGNVLSFG